MTKRIIGLLTALLLVGSLFASCKNESETEDGDEISGDFSIDVTDDGAMSPKQIFEKCFTVGTLAVSPYMQFSTEQETVYTERGESIKESFKRELYADFAQARTKADIVYTLSGETFTATALYAYDRGAMIIDGIEDCYSYAYTPCHEARNILAALCALDSFYKNGGLDNCITFAENLTIGETAYDNSSGIALDAKNVSFDGYTLNLTLRAVVENDKAIAFESDFALDMAEHVYYNGNHYEEILISALSKDGETMLSVTLNTETEYTKLTLSGSDVSGEGKLTTGYIAKNGEISDPYKEHDIEYRIENSALTLDYTRTVDSGFEIRLSKQVKLENTENGLAVTISEAQKGRAASSKTVISPCDEFTVTLPDKVLNIYVNEHAESFENQISEKYPAIAEFYGIAQNLNGDGGEDGIIELSDGNGTYILNSENNNGVYMTSFTIGQDSIVLNDKREIPLNYSELTYDEEGGKHIATINGRKYEISEYTDPDGTLCQSLICIDDIENLDFTASVLFYPELEYGDISLGFVYEIAKNGTEYTFTYPDGHKETRTVEYDSALGRYVFTDIEMTIE